MANDVKTIYCYMIRLFLPVQRHKHIIFLQQNPHQLLSHPAPENSCLFTFLGSWALSTGHKLAKTSGRCRGKPPRPVMGALVILMAVDDDVTHKSMSNLGRVGCYVLVLSLGLWALLVYRLYMCRLVRSFLVIKTE